MDLGKSVRHIFQTVWVTLFCLGAFTPGFYAQLNKLPSLVEHYRHHIEDHGQTGIVDFLAMHYTEASQHRDEEDHSDLPLFQMNHSCPVMITHEAEEFNFQNIAPSNPLLPLARDPFYSYALTKGIFQPPRLG